METKTPQTPAVLIFILAMTCLLSIVILTALKIPVPDIVDYGMIGSFSALGLGILGRGATAAVSPQSMDALASLVADKMLAHAQAAAVPTPPAPPVVVVTESARPDPSAERDSP